MLQQHGYRHTACMRLLYDHKLCSAGPQCNSIAQNYSYASGIVLVPTPKPVLAHTQVHIRMSDNYSRPVNTGKSGCGKQVRQKPPIVLCKQG